MQFLFQSTTVLFFTSLFLISLVPTAEARTVVRTGDVVSVTEEQTIDGDFYSTARAITISGAIEEDMIAAAQSLTVNGSVGDNAFLVALNADVSGTVGDDLRIIAQEVTISEPVMGDLFVIGGTVRILSTASIAGDVLLYASEVVIEGSVGGDVLGTIDSLRIDGPVVGDVDVAVNDFTIGSRAVIDGTVSYESNTVVNQALDATIGGELLRNDPVLPGNEASIRLAIIPSFILLFSVLAWYLVARKSLRQIVSHAQKKSIRPYFVGVLVVLFTPIAGVLLIGSVIGALVGVTLLFSYILLILLGLLAATAIVGQLLIRAFDHADTRLGMVSILAGTAVMTVLMLLPYIGQAALAVLLILAIGTMVDLLFRSQHP